MTHPTRPHRALALTAALLLAVALGCTQDPGDAGLSNPLDPDGPGGGDPFELTAGYFGGVVMVSWNKLDMAGVAQYDVLHSLVPEGPFAIAGTVDQPTTAFAHAEFSPSVVNYYKVRATDGLGSASAISQIAAFAYDAPPLLTIGDGAPTATRQVDLFVRSAAGDRAEVDSLADFSTSVTADLDENGEATIPWDLGPAAADEVQKYVYVRILAAKALGDVHVDSVEVAFSPDLRLEGDPDLVGSLTPSLQIDGDGVTGMRFAAVYEDLETLPWLDFATPYAGYLLDEASADSQLVYAEFACDFGFTKVDSVWAVPDSLNAIAFMIDNGAETTADLEVQVGADVAATQMRFALTLEDLAAAGWLDYAPITMVTLNGCEDGLTEVVFAQFRNDWFSPAHVNDDILWLPPEVLDVTIDVPDTVYSEVVVAVSGTAIAGTCSAPLDSVEFMEVGLDWVPVTGLESWSVDWLTPPVDGIATLTLKARVTAGAETDSVEVEVVVVP